MPPWWRTRQGQGRERVKRYRRRLTAQQKKERRQDNSRRLVCQHLSDSLCLLNRIGRKQPQCRLDRASLFFQHPVKLSTCSVWGIWCACIYTHVDVAQSLACLTNTASAKHCIYWYCPVQFSCFTARSAGTEKPYLHIKVSFSPQQLLQSGVQLN